MVSYRLVATAGFVAAAWALPLNINLGAYSPALVVGDGEISFGGGQDVSQLFNTLEGAAVNAATGQSNRGGAQAAAPAVAAPAAGQPAIQPTTPIVGDQVPSAAAANVATDPALSEQAASITTLQGMGKEIAPREGEDVEASKVKRDLQGFDRALQYAENALVKGPVVQLGTGEGGAGVGIIVDNRPAGGAGAGGAGGAEGAAVPAGGQRAGKRDVEESSQPKRRTKITTMYVKRGVPASMQTSKLDARDVKTVPVVAVPAKREEDVSEEKRESTTSIDAINLNVDDPEGITMTFVETEQDAE